MGKAKAIWQSVILTVATLAAILGTLVFLWFGLQNTSSGRMSVGSFVLLQGLMILLLFGCGLSTEKPVVWVSAASLIVVLLCGLGLTLYLYGWLGGPNALGPLPCNCFGLGNACMKTIAECQATHTALATHQAPPPWWPLHAPNP
jgi:hypothetical protein